MQTHFERRRVHLPPTPSQTESIQFVVRFTSKTPTLVERRFKSLIVWISFTSRHGRQVRPPLNSSPVGFSFLFPAPRSSSSRPCQPDGGGRYLTLQIHDKFLHEAIQKVCGGNGRTLDGATRLTTREEMRGVQILSRLILF